MKYKKAFRDALIKSGRSPAEVKAMEDREQEKEEELHRKIREMGFEPSVRPRKARRFNPDRNAEERLVIEGASFVPRNRPDPDVAEERAVIEGWVIFEPRD